MNYFFIAEEIRNFQVREGKLLFIKLKPFASLVRDITSSFCDILCIINTHRAKTIRVVF